VKKSRAVRTQVSAQDVTCQRDSARARDADPRIGESATFGRRRRSFGPIGHTPKFLRQFGKEGIAPGGVGPQEALQFLAALNGNRRKEIGPAPLDLLVAPARAEEIQEHDIWAAIFHHRAAPEGKIAWCRPARRATARGERPQEIARIIVGRRSRGAGSGGSKVPHQNQRRHGERSDTIDHDRTTTPSQGHQILQTHTDEQRPQKIHHDQIRLKNSGRGRLMKREVRQ